jgi:hypothetical protein
LEDQGIPEKTIFAGLGVGAGGVWTSLVRK